jgi:hypothetical protein
MCHFYTPSQVPSRHGMSQGHSGLSLFSPRCDPAHGHGFNTTHVPVTSTVTTQPWLLFQTISAKAFQIFLLLRDFAHITNTPCPWSSPVPQCSSSTLHCLNGPFQPATAVGDLRVITPPCSYMVFSVLPCPWFPHFIPFPLSILTHLVPVPRSKSFLKKMQIRKWCYI